MTTTAIIAKASGGREWTMGNQSRVYIDSLLKTPFCVSSVYVDVSENAKRRNGYGYTEETDCGTVAIECSEFISDKKRSALQDAIWALLDD